MQNFVPVGYSWKWLFSGRSTTTLRRYRSNRKEYRTDGIERLLRCSRKKKQKIKMLLFGELSQTSLYSFDFELESDSNKSWDVWLNSAKSGIFMFFYFFWISNRSNRSNRSNQSINWAIDRIDREPPWFSYSLHCIVISTCLQANVRTIILENPRSVRWFEELESPNPGRSFG